MSNGEQSATFIRLALERQAESATGMVRSLVAARHPFGDQWLGIAETLLAQDQIKLGKAALALLVLQSGNDPAAIFRSAQALCRYRLYEPAWDLLDGLELGSLPDDEHALLRGIVASNMGLMTVARQELRLAVRANPRLGRAWLRLAMITDRNSGDIHEALVRAGPAMRAASRHEQIRYQYALSKTSDDHSQRSEAFAALLEAKNLEDSQNRYDAVADASEANAALDGASPGDIASIGEQTRDNLRSPIIVTGLPRSGTTLVEHILASHSHVAGGDELGFFHRVATRIGGASVSHLKRHLAGGGTAGALVNYYIGLVDQRFDPSGRVVDKTLEASRYLGLAASLMPHAPIIWMRRDPLDCAWSTFRTYFGSRLAWTRDLVAIAMHFRLEDMLFTRWQGILGSRMLAVNYENLVSAPGQVIPRLLDHCGLAMEDAVLRPEQNRRPVTTMSVAQVRRPIGRDSIGCAGPYAEMLDPFVKAY